MPCAALSLSFAPFHPAMTRLPPAGVSRHHRHRGHRECSAVGRAMQVARELIDRWQPIARFEAPRHQLRHGLLLNLRGVG